MTINTTSRLQQVKASLLNYITRNQLQRNDRLPSEAAMAKMLGVSRNTLREAYLSLESEGVIVRRHGIGTFVAHSPTISDSLNEFAPFAQIIRQGGYTPSFQTLAVKHEHPPLDVREALGVAASESIPHVRRLVYADQRPVIYVDDYLAPFVDIGGIEWDSFDGSMVKFLATSMDTPLHQIQSRIRAASLEEEVARCLKLAIGTPVLSVRSTIYTIDNRPVMYSKILFNSSIVELTTVRIIRTT